MFTGLVEAIGEVAEAKAAGGTRTFRVRSPFPRSDLASGASIAIQGVCLTLIEPGSSDGVFRVQAARESLRRSTLATLRAGDRVHLERAVRVGDRLGGHLVQGHVDGIGTVRRSSLLSGNWVMDVAAPPALMRYVVEKGSIALDGVSLTVGKVGHGALRVHIIPATLAATLLGSYRAGRKVNIEVDVLAKYVERLIPAARRGKAV